MGGGDRRRGEPVRRHLALVRDCGRLRQIERLVRQLRQRVIQQRLEQ
jgi:hypothetical protein